MDVSNPSSWSTRHNSSIIFSLKSRMVNVLPRLKASPGPTWKPQAFQVSSLLKGCFPVLYECGLVGIDRFRCSFIRGSCDFRSYSSLFEFLMPGGSCASDGVFLFRHIRRGTIKSSLLDRCFCFMNWPADVNDGCLCRDQGWACPGGCRWVSTGDIARRNWSKMKLTKTAKQQDIIERGLKP